MIPSAGTLRVELFRRDGAVETRIQPPKPLPLADLLFGKSPDEASRFIPLVYNICAAAQELAARSALGLDLHEESYARVAEEMLRDHVLKLSTIWPVAMGETACRDALPLVGRALGDPQAAKGLKDAVLGVGRDIPEDWNSLCHWMGAGETGAARTFAAVAAWTPVWGLADLPPLEVDTPVDWVDASGDGGPVENSAAARAAPSRLMREIAEQRGHGPLWRMAARLVEVDQILSGQALPALAKRGVAQAARGAMMADAGVEGGRVTFFRRLSPTDFALAPGGLLETAFASLPGDPSAPLEQIARMVLETIDPCLPTELEIVDA